MNLTAPRGDVCLDVPLARAVLTSAVFTAAGDCASTPRAPTQQTIGGHFRRLHGQDGRRRLSALSGGALPGRRRARRRLPC